MGDLNYYSCKIKVTPDQGKPRSEQIIIEELGITEVEKAIQLYMKDSIDLWEITNISKTNIDTVIKKS